MLSSPYYQEILIAMYIYFRKFCLVLFLSSFALRATGENFHVSTTGNDTWSGTLERPNRAKTDGPFATPEGARDAIRRFKSSHGLPDGGIRVTIRGGDYPLGDAFRLGEVDSGRPDARILYAAKEGDAVRLLGGRVVPKFEKVRDAATLDRLDEGARGHIMQADLKAMGISDFGSPVGGGLELFFDGEPMTLSRWPNEGFSRVVKVIVDDGHEIHGNKGSKIGKFRYRGRRPKRWTQETDLWEHGYWFWDWSDQRQQIESIDTEKSIITIKAPYHGYGYRKGQWYYVYNTLVELDTPGEWYLDRESGMLYFWPPKRISKYETIVSLKSNAIIMDNVSHVTIEGITI
jgi:hypothetical protein